MKKVVKKKVAKKKPTKGISLTKEQIAKVAKIIGTDRMVLCAFDAQGVSIAVQNIDAMRLMQTLSEVAKNVSEQVMKK